MKCALYGKRTVLCASKMEKLYNSGKYRQTKQFLYWRTSLKSFQVPLEFFSNSVKLCNCIQKLHFFLAFREPMVVDGQQQLDFSHLPSVLRRSYVGKTSWTTYPQNYKFLTSEPKGQGNNSHVLYSPDETNSDRNFNIDEFCCFYCVAPM